MKNEFRNKMRALSGVALFTLSLGIFLASPDAGLTQAPPAPVAGVLQIAASIKNGNNPAAKNQAAALAKAVGIDGVMDVFKLRKKNGIGVGKGGITPDGIQSMLNDLELGRFAPAAVIKESAALEEMGYQIAAVADVTALKPPMNFVGKQQPKNWLAWSAEVRDGAAELAKAAKAKKPADVKTAAATINAACNSCHTDFRE